MTCPTCNLPTAPGAYCDGNGSHPPRRAKRPTREERRAAWKAAEARREAERTRAALIEVARPVVESAQQRRYLHRRGELAAELAEAVAVGLITSEGAAELEARTAREVEAIDAEKDRRRVAWEAKEAATAAHVEAHGHCEECDSAIPTECHRWPLEAQAGHRCQCLCHPRPERAPRSEPEPRRRTSHRSALFTVALVGELMGVGGMTTRRE